MDERQTTGGRDRRAAWRAAPVLPLRTVIGPGPVLVLAPHADDETIGCGGLIRQAARQGIPVAVDILTDGARSHPRSRTHDRARLAALRQAEARAAVAVLGLTGKAVAFWEEADSGLAPTPALVAHCIERIAHTRAATVLVTWAGDPHCDHEAAFAIALEACLASPRVPRLLAYPVWSWTIEPPHHPREGGAARLAIADELAAKTAALACHASQLGQVIHDDPDGFVLSDEQMALFLQPFETFITVDLGQDRAA